MNELEKLGLVDILRTLGDADLFSLVDTTTKHMVIAENREEAFQVILTYSENAATLLRRKKIRKHTLFNYLRRHNVVVSISGEKIDYVRACLQLWNSTDFQLTSLHDIEEMESEVAPIQDHSPPVVGIGIEDIHKLGFQFSHWFFDNLNHLKDFGPHHFWPDCQIYLHIMYANSKSEEYSTMGSEHVSRCFLDFVQNQSLFFQLSAFDDGVKSQQDEHGLIKVLTHGTLHQNSNCTGLFDISFGLISDPTSQYTWKVKIVSVKLRVNNPSMRVTGSGIVPPLC